jgi:NitT/TauT family transport system permease protein
MKAQRVITAVLFFAALLFLWHYGRKALPMHHQLLVPDPLDVWNYLVTSAKDGTLFAALFVTMKRLLLGYFAGVVVGVPLGLLTARSQWAADTIGVLGLGLQTLPSVCWVPLALLAFGQTEASMQFVVIMGTLWSVQISTDAGVRNVPPIYQRAAQTMGSRGIHTWVKVILPASLPFIISGVKQGWAFAWRSLMAAEIYVTILTGFGLGQLLHYGRELHAMDQVIGVMLIIVFIGLLADKILFSPWERFLHKRWGLVKS